MTPEQKDDLLDWAETLLCNAVPMSHCGQEEWDKIVIKWRDEKHGIAKTDAKPTTELALKKLKTTERQRTEQSCPMPPTPEALRAAMECVKYVDDSDDQDVILIATVIDSSTGLPALLAERTALREALQLILPMAKGYAHANNVGNNWQFVEQAENALANQGTKP